MPIGSREQSQHAASLARGGGCIAIWDPVVRISADCTFGSETDIAVAGYNALLYRFPDVQLVVEMAPNHVYLLKVSG